MGLDFLWVLVLGVGLIIAGKLPRWARWLLSGTGWHPVRICSRCMRREGKMGMATSRCVCRCAGCSRAFLYDRAVGIGAVAGWMMIHHWKGWSGEGWIGGILVLFLALAALTDGWCRLIPDRLTLSGAFLFALLRVWVGDASYGSYVMGFLAGGGILMFIAWISRGGMGGGDIKMLAASGWVLGWPGVLVGLALAVMSGGLLALGLVAGRRLTFRTAMPFGPHLALGVWIAYLWGDPIWNWYFGLLS